MKVRFTPSARSQFFSGLEYIKARNPLAALALLARAKKSLRRLSTYPQSGRRIPEFPELPHREVIVPPSRLQSSGSRSRRSLTFCFVASIQEG